MTSDQIPESTTEVAAGTAVLWNMPWHARLKNLAQLLGTGVAQVPATPGRSVHTWLERVRAQAP